MKKFLMTFAAMLLVSAGAFAQSSETPLKGDVNEDGVVDVADITAVIGIIKNNATPQQTYYYVGQNPSDMFITDLNYTSIATQNAFTTKTINMTAGNYLYVVVPSNKTVKITDPATNVVAMNFYNSSNGTYGRTQNLETSGYYLIRSRATAAVSEAWTVTVSDTKTYYFSVGVTPITSDNYTTVNNVTTTIPTSETYWNNSGSKSYIYVLAPSNKTVTATDAALSSISSPLILDNSVSIANHNVYYTDGKIANGGGITVNLE